MDKDRIKILEQRVEEIMIKAGDIVADLRATDQSQKAKIDELETRIVVLEQAGSN